VDLLGAYSHVIAAAWVGGGHLDPLDTLSHVTSA